MELVTKFIIITFSILVEVQGQPEYVQQIKSSPGLYFDYLGGLKIKNGQLDVLIPLDITHLKPHIANVDSVLNTARTLCKQTGAVEPSGCFSVLEPLTFLYHDMNREFMSISHLLDNRRRRSAWISGIGTMFKQIFGTLDEDDGIRYSNAIEEVQNDQKKLATLMKENILVTTSIISSYNKTINKIRINEANLNRAINELSSNLRNISIETDELLLKFHETDFLNKLEMSIIVLSFHIEDIVNAVLFSRQNILHPSIVNPQQLHQELVTSHRHLPENVKLPIVLDLSSIHYILNISKTICYFINNKIIFVLQIPLVSDKNFMLFHNIALPTPHNQSNPNSFSLVLPDSKYIAMTKDKLHYCNLNSLESCKTTIGNNFVCDVNNVYATDAKPSCATELMSKVISEIPVQCNTKFIHGKVDIWKPINNNKWLFVQTDPNKISIDCVNSKLYENSILGTGVITIPSGCTGFCKSTILLSRYITVNLTSPVKSPDFNLLNDTCCNLDKFTKVSKNVPQIELLNIDLDELKMENNILKESKDLDVILNKPHIIQYGTHYSTLIIIITIVLIICIFYKILKCRSYGNLRNLHSIWKNRSSPTEIDIDRQDIDSDIPIPTLRARI